MLRKTGAYIYKHGMSLNKIHHPFIPSSFEEGKPSRFYRDFQYAVFQYRDGGEVDNFNKYTLRNIGDYIEKENYEKLLSDVNEIIAMLDGLKKAIKK